MILSSQSIESAFNPDVWITSCNTIKFSTLMPNLLLPVCLLVILSTYCILSYSFLLFPEFSCRNRSSLAAIPNCLCMNQNESNHDRYPCTVMIETPDSIAFVTILLIANYNSY
jgi:hypothetical protein